MFHIALSSTTLNRTVSPCLMDCVILMEHVILMNCISRILIILDFKIVTICIKKHIVIFLKSAGAACNKEKYLKTESISQVKNNSSDINTAIE